MSQRRPDDDTVPFGMRSAAAWAWRILVIALAIYVLLRLLSLLIVLVAPVLIAVLLVALVRPLADLLSRWMPRGVASLLSLLSVLAVVAGLVTSVVDPSAGAAIVSVEISNTITAICFRICHSLTWMEVQTPIASQIRRVASWWAA